MLALLNINVLCIGLKCCGIQFIVYLHHNILGESMQITRRRSSGAISIHFSLPD